MSEGIRTTETNIQKLEIVLKRGDQIISMLEKQGVDTEDCRRVMREARESFSSGDAATAYKLAEQCVGNLMGLKEKLGTERKDEKGGASKKGKGVFALIRDNNIEILKKIDEWKLIIRGWREKGYDFERDDSLFSRKFEEIEKRFISIGEQIEKAEAIRSRINRLREEHSDVGMVYKNKLSDIENAVFKLDRLDDLDRRLRTVTQTIKLVGVRFTNLRNRIGRYSRGGLKTRFLEEILENDEDIDYIEKQFDIYGSNLDFLLKEKQKLKTFKEDQVIDNYRDQVREIESMMDDPVMLDRVVEKMIHLEKFMKADKDRQKKHEEERRRRIEIRKFLDKYASEGYKVSTVEQLLDENINLLEEEYDIFMRQVAKLKSLKERLFKMDATGFEDEISKLSEKLNDPSNLDAIEKELDALKQSILDHRMRSQKLENAVKEWSGMGFKVNKLEAALKKDVSEAEKVYDDYKSRIKELSDYELRLQEMSHKDISDQVHKLSLMIKNPELIETVRKEMERVQRTVSEIEAIKNKRKELNELLKVWKSQGYRIERVLEIMKEENTFDGLEEVILNYTRSIAALESFRSELAVEERGWFPQLEASIKENMYNPDRAQEILKRFGELKGLNRKEERRRGEIQRKIRELGNRGIEVSKIEPFLLGDSQALTTEYGKFKENVKRMLNLKKTLLNEAHRTSDRELDMLARSMNNPYAIDEYERQQDPNYRPPTAGQEPASGTPKRDQARPISGSDSQSVDQLKDAAKKLFKDNNFEEALRLFDLVLAVEPGNKEGQFYRKKILAKLKVPGAVQPSMALPPPPAEDQDMGPANDQRDRPEEKSGSAPFSASEKAPNPNCLSCKGSGKCIWCQGTGKCSTCNGTGLSLGASCLTCKSSGRCSVCKGTGGCSWCLP